ncbi:hypothetical protein BD779DRAFT_1566606 [Infundibulicybe gibba]|nr:hypothetical protein BD779DRAFT_1566606 [Infundibulicybe gibba]
MSDGSDNELWRPSNSPSEHFTDASGADENDEWPVEIVGEEVDHRGEVRYEARWGNWKRPDGTNVTWNNSYLDPGILRRWKHAQKIHRNRLARESQEIELWFDLDVHNDETRLRAQAYEEKLRISPEIDLEEQMLRLREKRSQPPRSIAPLPVRAKSNANIFKKPRSLRDKLYMEWNYAAHSCHAAKITLSNEVDDDEVPDVPPGFEYIETGYVYSPGIPQFEDDGLFVKCECGDCSSAETCGCQDPSELLDSDGRRGYAYTSEGLFNFTCPPGVIVIECNRCCECDMHCINRVAQRPRDVPIEIFKTRNRGWGVRSPVHVERGKVLGIYTGLLLTRESADNLVDNVYCFDLDGQENVDDSERVSHAYSVDSKRHGNWTRFINHSCSPNLRVYLVVYDNVPEMYTPYLAFVATEDIEPGNEFTFDYDPAAGNTQAKGKGKGKQRIPEGASPCECGSASCRGWMR